MRSIIETDPNPIGLITTKLSVNHHWINLINIFLSLRGFQKPKTSWAAKELNPKKVTKLACYNALEKFTKNLTTTQNGETLQSECKKKVDQVEDQIHQRDTEILDLSKTEESLSEKLT